MNTLKVTQIRSLIGRPSSHHKCVRALGLGRIGRTRQLTDTPQVRGLINKVGYLLRVEEG